MNFDRIRDLWAQGAPLHFTHPEKPGFVFTFDFQGYLCARGGDQVIVLPIHVRDFDSGEWEVMSADEFAAMLPDEPDVETYLEPKAAASGVETDTNDFDEAMASMRRQAWVTRKVGGKWLHLCPACTDVDGRQEEMF